MCLFISFFKLCFFLIITVNDSIGGGSIIFCSLKSVCISPTLLVNPCYVRLRRNPPGIHPWKVASCRRRYRRERWWVWRFRCCCGRGGDVQAAERCHVTCSLSDIHRMAVSANNVPYGILVFDSRLLDRSLVHYFSLLLTVSLTRRLSVAFPHVSNRLGVQYPFCSRWCSAPTTTRSPQTWQAGDSGNTCE